MAKARCFSHCGRAERWRDIGREKRLAEKKDLLLLMRKITLQILLTGLTERRCIF